MLIIWNCYRIYRIIHKHILFLLYTYTSNNRFQVSKDFIDGALPPTYSTQKRTQSSNDNLKISREGESGNANATGLHSPARGLYELHMTWGLRRDLALESDRILLENWK